MVRLTRRLIVRLAAGLLGAVLLAVVLLIVLAATIDPNRFKGRIAAAVQQHTGRALQLPGDLRWRFFPWPLIETGAGSLGNPAGFDGDEFARWRALRVGVRLWPLLHRELSVDALQLDGLVVNLRQDVRGQGNWQFGSGASAASGASGASGGSGGITALQVGRFALRDTSVSYRDVSGMRWRLSDLTIDARIPAVASTRQLRIAGLRVATQVQAAALGAQRVAASFEAPRIELDVDTQGLSVPEWHAAFGSATLEGTALRVNGTSGSASGTLQLRTASLRQLLAAAGIAAPATADPAVLGRFELTAQISVTRQLAQLDALRVRLDDTQLQGSASATLAQPALRFALQGDRLDVDRYLEPDEAVGKPLRLPLRELKGLHANGTVRLQNAQVAGADMQGVTLTLESEAPVP